MALTANHTQNSNENCDLDFVVATSVCSANSNPLVTMRTSKCGQIRTIHQQHQQYNTNKPKLSSVTLTSALGNLWTCYFQIWQFLSWTFSDMSYNECPSPHIWQGHTNCHAHENFTGWLKFISCSHDDYHWWY